MCKIGIVFGSDSGVTEEIASKIHECLGEDLTDVIDVYDADVDYFDKYNKLILGLSTWYDGELQSAWEEFLDDFKTVDFTGKTVALFGLGDQIGYGEYFCDGVGIIGEVVKNNGGKIIGQWPTEGYDYDESKADLGNGKFMGLLLDEDNQSELTQERIEKWIEQVKKEFNL
ncbi:flavodoxin [Ichthyobacterium seriolicida]|uniref:Flavodoxin n=1 Tax=Ichthyobacterium seriolicida TaxID=242600 RepID=A0A1J1DW59_9FLAO|nr:flavodoxin [Ichthyobacterium seriolicida]BAV94098.1 flavodoxin 1 [Ichthyobacterium seriolicida]